MQAPGRSGPLRLCLANASVLDVRRDKKRLTQRMQYRWSDLLTRLIKLIVCLRGSWKSPSSIGKDGLSSAFATPLSLLFASSSSFSLSRSKAAKRQTFTSKHHRSNSVSTQQTFSSKQIAIIHCKMQQHYSSNRAQPDPAEMELLLTSIYKQTARMLQQKKSLQDHIQATGNPDRGGIKQVHDEQVKIDAKLQSILSDLSDEVDTQCLADTRRADYISWTAAIHRGKAPQGA